jgi:hypothetical protein
VDLHKIRKGERKKRKNQNAIESERRKKGCKMRRMCEHFNHSIPKLRREVKLKLYFIIFL